MKENDDIILSTELVQLLTPDQAWHYSILPKLSTADTLEFYIAASDSIIDVKEELEVLFGKNIKLIESDPGQILKTLGKYYRKKTKADTNGSNVRVLQKSDDFLVNLIAGANEIGSSDIHIETYEEKCRIRIRVDGKLIERFILRRDEYPALINKIKIKANLDIAEKRLPQDGRIFFTSGKDKFDIRVSVLPTLYGEKIVLRLLSKDATNIDINILGFSPRQLEDYLEAIKRPNGIVLISGPTGSGKTTTLYATLRILNHEHTNILTIEDPIEYTLEGINQVQLKEDIGLTFASALRTFLRQDPDIIMLGEIRDGETAQMATRAALTGHLVLSTIHTNSAWGTISRLIDMGVPSFLLANTINISVALRLVRLLCPHCKQEMEFDHTLLPRNFANKTKIEKHFVAKGCDECFYTGYKGRKAVYEIIPIDHDLANLIKNKQLDVNDILREKGIVTLAEGALSLVQSGASSVDECYSLLMNQI
jgi:general secretion pathway protein E/type IV pilus assembly protein PilB